MCRRHRFVGCALLAFLNRGVFSDAVSAPNPHNFWIRGSDAAMNASESQTTANSTSLYPDSNFNVSEECVLWDNTCHGDKKNAASIFYGKTLAALLENECFTGTDSASDVVVGLNNMGDEEPAPYDPAQCPGGLSGVPLATSSMWSSLKSWMREPACASSSLVYSPAVSQPPAQDAIYGCCGPCAIGGPNVDVYYWPSPEANTSCLSIIGTSVNPPTESATTDAGYTYWGYTPTDANIDHQIVTTMVYTSINGVYFKMPMSNPWESKPGASTSTDPGMWNLPSTTPLSWSTPNIQGRGESPEAKIQARANPIAISSAPQALMNQSKWDTIRNDSAPPSVVTSGSHTFTSPSIYVNFYSLSATDSCGYRGTSINSTLIAFAPGELSTVATAMYPVLQSTITPGSVYNFDNLPCPPMSVMWSQWYKPEPGEPYRPLIIFPSKLLDIDPLWKVCTQGPFTGYDPPRTLDPATAMVPKVTPPSNSNPDPRPATPAATQENLPSRTTTPADPTQTSSDPSFAKSDGSGSMQGDPSQQNDPPRGTNKAAADPSSNNQGNENLQGQSLQKEPTSSEIKNSPTNHASPNNAANSNLDQPNDMHVSGGPSMEDVGTAHQLQPLATSAQASMNAVPSSHHVSASDEGNSIDGVDVRPGDSAPDVTGQQIAGDSSNDPQIVGQTAHIEPAVSLMPTTIANHVITPLSKGVAIQGFTLNNGGPATVVASTTFSLDTSGNMVVNGQSYRLHNESPVPTTINGEAVMPLPTGISIHSTTLTPNAPALVISGTSYSLDSSSKLHFGGSSYVSSVKIADVDPTQINTIAGLPVIELQAGVSMADKTPATGAKATEGLSGVHITLDSSDLIIGSVTIPVQNIPSSGSLPESTSGGLSNQNPGTTNGNSTIGNESNSNPLAFTGGSEARKRNFSMLLLVLIGACTIIAL